jgi:hypothetical protein
MIKSPLVVLTLLIPSALLVAPAHAGDEKDKSPDDVFKSFTAAMKKDDMKAAMSCVTRDSQSYLAGTMWYAAELSREFFGFMNDKITPKQKKEHTGAIDEVLKRHGLSQDAWYSILDKDDKRLTKDEDITRVYVALGECVKDKSAFVTEVLKVLKTRGEAIQDIDEAKRIWEGIVKEVKIDGKQARCQLTFAGADGKEQTATIYFKSETEVWKMDLIETYRNWPQPPPPREVKPAAKVQPAPRYDSRPGLLRRLLSRLCIW